MINKLDSDSDMMAGYIAAQRNRAPEATSASMLPTTLPKPVDMENDPQTLQETMHEAPISSAEPETSAETVKSLFERIDKVVDQITSYNEFAFHLYANPDLPKMDSEIKDLEDLAEKIKSEVETIQNEYHTNLSLIQDERISELNEKIFQLLDSQYYVEGNLKYLKDFLKLNPELAKNGMSVPTTLPEDGSQILHETKPLPPDESKPVIPEPVIGENDTVATEPIVETLIPDGATQPRPAVDLGNTVPMTAVKNPGETNPVPVAEKKPTFLDQRPQWQQDIVALLPPDLRKHAETIAGKLENRKYRQEARTEYAERQAVRQWLSDQFAAMREMNVAGRGFDLRGMTNYVGQMVERMSAAQPADKLKVAEDYWNHLSGPERSMMLAVLAVVGRQDATPMKMDASLQGQYQKDPEARRVAQLLTEKLSNVASLGQAFATEYLPVLKDLFVRAQMLLEEPRTGTAQPVGGTAESQAVAKTPSGPENANQQQPEPKNPGDEPSIVIPKSGETNKQLHEAASDIKDIDLDLF